MKKGDLEDKIKVLEKRRVVATSVCIKKSLMSLPQFLDTQNFHQEGLSTQKFKEPKIQTMPQKENV